MSAYEDLDYMADCIARGDSPRAVLGVAVRAALEAERARLAAEASREHSQPTLTAEQARSLRVSLWGQRVDTEAFDALVAIANGADS
jgi:hypothetical protein